MARASSIRKAQTFKPYLYREVEEFHLEQLRHFLDFIYAQYRDSLHLRADLLPLLFDKPFEAVLKKIPYAHLEMLPDRDLEWLLNLQDTIRDMFKKMIEKANTGEGYIIPSVPDVLRLSEWSGGEKAYLINPIGHATAPEHDEARMVISNVAHHLRALREKALGRCEECSHFFLRLDKRAARFCSQNCRMRAGYKNRQEALKKSRQAQTSRRRGKVKIQRKR